MYADCPFFLGLGAISSVPLALIEVTTILGLPGTTEALRSLFAVIFLIVRTAYWPIVSAGFWSDIFALGTAGQITNQFAAGFFLVANVGLTGLQLFWTRMIVNGIRQMLRGGGSPAEEVPPKPTAAKASKSPAEVRSKSLAEAPAKAPCKSPARSPPKLRARSPAKKSAPHSSTPSKKRV